MAVNEFIFKQPVSVGDLLASMPASCASAAPRSRCTWKWWPSAIPENPQAVKVTEANLTYVAIDKQGKPREIPR